MVLYRCLMLFPSFCDIPLVLAYSFSVVRHHVPEHPVGISKLRIQLNGFIEVKYCCSIVTVSIFIYASRVVDVGTYTFLLIPFRQRFNLGRLREQCFKRV